MKVIRTFAEVLRLVGPSARSMQRKFDAGTGFPGDRHIGRCVIDGRPHAIHYDPYAGVWVALPSATVDRDRAEQNIAIIRDGDHFLRPAVRRDGVVVRKADPNIGHKGFARKMVRSLADRPTPSERRNVEQPRPSERVCNVNRTSRPISRVQAAHLEMLSGYFMQGAARVLVEVRRR